MTQMPWMMRGSRGALFSPVVCSRHPFEDIKESLTGHRSRVHFNNKTCASCDDCANLCSAAATELGLSSRQVMGAPLDVLIVVHAHKPGFPVNVFGGEVSAS